MVPKAARIGAPLDRQIFPREEAPVAEQVEVVRVYRLTLAAASRQRTHVGTVSVHFLWGEPFTWARIPRVWGREPVSRRIDLRAPSLCLA